MQQSTSADSFDWRDEIIEAMNAHISKDATAQFRLRMKFCSVRMRFDAEMRQSMQKSKSRVIRGVTGAQQNCRAFRAGA